MKNIIVFLLLLTSEVAISQKVLRPGKKLIDRNWIQPGTSTMTWYALRGSTKMEMGKVTTTLSIKDHQLIVETSVKLKGMNGKWVDSTIADLRTLAPVYHSSTNMQRDMTIRFGKVVQGWHYDKMKKKTTERLDTLERNYFDSNLYPQLIGWLPLNEGYTATLNIYDFNPDARSGVLKAFVKGVKSTTLESANHGNTEVWAVTVSDEIGNGENGESTYYFTKKSRELLKQEIRAGNRVMVMERD